MEILHLNKKRFAILLLALLFVEVYAYLALAAGSLSPGQYLIGSPYVIDGGYYTAYWGFPPAAEANAENGSPVGSNPAQWFLFTASGTNYSICDVQNGACLTDGGSSVDIGQGTDIWSVNSVGSGYTVQNTRTGRYIGAIPTITRASVPISATAVTITLTVAGNATPSPVPSATPTTTSSPTPARTPAPTPSSTPGATASPTPSVVPSAIQFDGRTQNNTNAAGTSVSATTPSGVRDGDYLVVTVDSWDSNLPAPASWTLLRQTNNKVVSNGSGDHIALIYRVWHTGDPTSYSLGNGQLAYPKAVLRAYYGVGAIDAFACSPSPGAVTTGPSFTLANPPATKSTGEEFIGEWSTDNTAASVNGPSDLGDGTAEKTQWSTFDGDKPIPASGTIPTSETANSASGSPNWIGCDVTLVPSTAQISTPAMKANDFLNTLGVVSHFVQGQENATATTAALRYLAVRNLRVEATHSTSLLAQICSIHSMAAVLIDELPIVDDDPNNIADTRTEYETLAACGALLEAEGPNEPNNFNFKYLGNTCSSNGSYLPCAQYMAAEYAMIKGDAKLASYPVADLTEPGGEPDNTGLQFLTIPSGQGTSMPSGTKFADIANLHNYVLGLNQSAVGDNQAWNAESTLNNAPWDGLIGEYCRTTWGYGYAAIPIAQCTLPKVTTETGWPSTTITQDQQGKLITNVYLSAAKLGWSHTFVYLLFDKPSAGDTGWGFFSQSDGTANLQPKALGSYTHNLTTVLSDATSNFSSGSARYLIVNEPATVHDLLMQKSNGTYELLIWDDRPVGEATDRVTVNLGVLYPTVKVYDITSGTAPTQTLSNSSSVTLSLTDHAFIVEF